MRPLRLFSVLALIAALAVPIAGCGQSQEEEFEEDYQSVSDKIVDVGQRVSRTIADASSRSNRELAREFKRSADELGEVRDELQDLDTPGDLEASRDKLIEAVQEQERNLDKLAKAAREGDAATTGRTVRDLIRASPPLRDARRALEREAEKAADGS